MLWWYQLEEALPDLVQDPGLFWRAGVSSQQQTESPVVPPPHSVQAFTELFLSQPGVTWAEEFLACQNN